MSFWPQLINLCNFGPGMTNALTFEQQMAALPGLIAYWKLTETIGTTADNAEGTAARDGTYINTPTLAGQAFPIGNAIAVFNGANECVNVYSASLASAFNGTKGWLVVWFADATSGTEADNYVIYLSNDGTSYVRASTDATTPSQIGVFYSAAGTIELFFPYNISASLHMIALDWNDDGDTVRFWWDGVLWATNTGVGTWSGALHLNVTAIAAQTRSGTRAWNGAVGHVAIGAGQVLSSALVEQVYRAAIPTINEIAFAGDSKLNGAIWATMLAGLLSDNAGSYWRMNPLPVNGSGWLVANLHTNLDTSLPTASGNPSIACINIGVNNAAVALPAEATWKADLVGCIDAFRAKWPTIQVYVSRIWDRRDPVDCVTLNSWIDDIIALYDYVYAGPDESVWLENGDNGVTYTSDGTHYNTAGQLEAAAQWLTALGY